MMILFFKTEALRLNFHPKDYRISLLFLSLKTQENKLISLIYENLKQFKFQTCRLMMITQDN